MNASTGNIKVQQKEVLLYPVENIKMQYTPDSLKLLLMDYEKELHKIDWTRVIELAALFISTLLALITGNLSEFFKGVFLLAIIGSGGLLIYFFGRNIYYSCVKRPISANQLVDVKVAELRKQLEAEYTKLKPTTFGGEKENVSQDGIDKKAF